MKTKALLKYWGKLLSTAFKSFESLLKIRPRGILSKNSFKDENKRLLAIDSWMSKLIFGEEWATNKALIKAKVP